MAKPSITDINLIQNEIKTGFFYPKLNDLESQSSWENFDFSPFHEKWKWFAIDYEGFGCLFSNKPHLNLFLGLFSIYNLVGKIDENVIWVGDFHPENWNKSLQERTL